MSDKEPETLEDALNRTADEAWGGGGKKQSELINLPFRLDAVRLIKFQHKDEETGETEERESYMATISLSDKEPEEYYLGGRIVMAQVKWLIANDKFPAMLKLVRDSARKGSPYVLKQP